MLAPQCVFTMAGRQADRRPPKSVEPRGAITPGVPELRLELGSQDVRGLIPAARPGIARASAPQARKPVVALCLCL